MFLRSAPSRASPSPSADLSGPLTGRVAFETSNLLESLLLTGATTSQLFLGHDDTDTALDTVTPDPRKCSYRFV